MQNVFYSLINPHFMVWTLSLSGHCMRICNRLHEETRMATSISNFKSQIKKMDWENILKKILLYKIINAFKWY